LALIVTVASYALLSKIIARSQPESHKQGAPGPEFWVSGVTVSIPVLKLVVQVQGARGSIVEVV